MKRRKGHLIFLLSSSQKYRTRIVWKAIILLLFIFMTFGCQPSPEEKFLSQENPSKSAKLFQSFRIPHMEKGGSKVFDFFYATTRIADESGDSLIPYGSNIDEQLRPGTFKIQLFPKRDLRGNSPKKWKGIRLMELQELEEDVFFNHLQNAVESSPYKSLFIIVFGYRNTFQSALLKTAKLSLRVDINTPVLVFDWPGDQALSVGGYKRAFSFAKQSGSLLGELISMIIAKVKPKKLWLGGGSLGTQVICNAFAQMMKHTDLADKDPEIDHVILAAPDVGDDEFDVQFKDEIAALSRKLTAYVAADDKALLLSGWIHGSSRLGKSRAESQKQFEEMIDLLELEEEGAKNITVIDITPVNRATLGHTFYVESSEFFDDVYQRLLLDSETTGRRLYRTNYTKDVGYWVLRDDSE
jgi:esterase/lipase superfamily enzyme